jgi:hypothetical protein
MASLAPMSLNAAAALEMGDYHEWHVDNNNLAWVQVVRGIPKASG